MSSTYRGNRKFISTDSELSIRISSDEALSFDDFAQIVKDIQSIYKQVSREVTQKLKGANTKNRDAILVIKEFKTGSLEIVANPYFQGIVSGITANAVGAIFIHVMLRVNGKRQVRDRELLDSVDNDVISDEAASNAAANAITSTNRQRGSLRTKCETFGLSIAIKLKGRVYSCTED